MDADLEQPKMKGKSKILEDEESSPDQCMTPDHFGEGKVDEEIQITEIPLDTQFKDRSGKPCNFKTEKEAIAALSGPRGGKSKRKTYKKTNKKKKK